MGGSTPTLLLRLTNKHEYQNNGRHKSVIEAAMQRYRCFCMTDDNKIITGAFIEAEGVTDATEAARRLWHDLAGFDHVQVWAGAFQLHPQNASKTVRQSLKIDSGPGAQVREPAVPVNKSVFGDHIVCLECGKNFRTLKYHLRAQHSMTRTEYRQRFGLLRDYPLVALSIPGLTR